MILSSEIRFADQKTKNNLHSLQRKKPELWKSIANALEAVEKNAFSGIQIPKRLIPKSYKKSYQVPNLWKLDLNDGWRLLYSIVRDDEVVISIVLDCISHKKYEKTMNY